MQIPPSQPLDILLLPLMGPGAVWGYRLEWENRLQTHFQCAKLERVNKDEYEKTSCGCVGFQGYGLRKLLLCR